MREGADECRGLPARPATPGEYFSDLEELYGRLLGQWATELTHVAQIVGGFNCSRNRWARRASVLPQSPARGSSARCSS